MVSILSLLEESTYAYSWNVWLMEDIAFQMIYKKGKRIMLD